jgi:DNA invertase Pin-like site-specific DNA recombinase
MSVLAAQYVRMSTDLQKYSIENQKVAIQQYALQHGFAVMKTYTDAGRSGVVLKSRAGLKELLADVLTGNAIFKAILVYDVSRWGRFQDSDEAAHYEFLCKDAGIPVHYCAELFQNDGTLPNSLFKSLKRMMAAEYSRELGVKVFGAQKKLAQLGFRMGGQPGYGLRRLLVSNNPKLNRRLETGQRKDPTDHIILVPGPRKEVECVRAIYAMALTNLTMSEIARRLNRHGIPFLGGKDWTSAAVGRTLRNPKYAGVNTWNRMTCKLHSRPKNLPREQWIVTPYAYPPVIDPDTFERVQVALKKRLTRPTDEELLDVLRRLLRRKGELTENIIKNARNVPNISLYYNRFGPFREIFKRIGYEPPPANFAKAESRAISWKLRAQVLAQIAELFPQRAQFFCLLARQRVVVQLDKSLTISLLMCRSDRTRGGGLGWNIIPIPSEREYTTLLCRLNKGNTEVHSFYLFREIDKGNKHSLVDERDPWWAKGKRIKLEQLGDSAKEMSRSENAG